jgi:hypothetical protein
LRFCFEISGLTRSQSSPDTAHDLIALIIQCIMNASFKTRNYLRISTKKELVCQEPKYPR